MPAGNGMVNKHNLLWNSYFPWLLNTSTRIGGPLSACFNHMAIIHHAICWIITKRHTSVFVKDSWKFCWLNAWSLIFCSWYRSLYCTCAFPILLHIDVLSRNWDLRTILSFSEYLVTISMPNLNHDKQTQSCRLAAAIGQYYWIVITWHEGKHKIICQSIWKFTWQFYGP